MTTGQTIISLVSTLGIFAGLTLGTLQWMLNRHDQARTENSNKIMELQVKLLELRAELPINYVRREDWIRISNTLEAKLDAMRAEMNQAGERLRGEVMEKISELNRVVTA